jgi:hypothetical protein
MNFLWTLYYPIALAVPYVPTDTTTAPTEQTKRPTSTTHLLSDALVRDYFWVTETLFVITVLLAVHISTRRLIEKIKVSERCGINDALVVIIGIALSVIAYCGIWLIHTASDHHVAQMLSGTFVWICYGVQLIKVIRIRWRLKVIRDPVEDRSKD